ncbi:flavin reductase family protein [Lentzea sp. NPDC005914]|uniref:flavin reductase family protein n=1 Tax=Lentzea sp. NPDC005914 TaxID=3154572 RepID=UPI0033CD38A8
MTRELRDCLGHFATGVTVVTCEIDGVKHGATVNSFTAVSLEPPLVLVSLDRRSKACHHLDNRPFVVNVLKADQGDIAMHFAGRPAARPIPWDGTRIRDSLAHIVCAPWRSYDGGDHVLYLGEVEEIEVHQGDPLVFYRGAFREAGA